VHDRNRRAPVALARDTPVAQPPLHLFFSEAFRFQVLGDRVNRLLVAQPVVLSRIDAKTVLGEFFPPDDVVPRLEQLVDLNLLSEKGDSAGFLRVRLVFL